MADDVWGRPRIPTGESVAAALGLARQLRPDTCLLCDREDGATELLVRKDGEDSRYVAYASGATEQLESRKPASRYRAGKTLAFGGSACATFLIGAAFVSALASHDPGWILVPFFVAVALILCGTLLGTQWARIKAPDDLVPARIPYDLDGWAPRTVAQLATVEQLAEAGDKDARIRNMTDGRIEVETFHKRERRLHVLDPFGAVVESETTAVAGGIVWATRLPALGLVIPFAAVALFGGLLSFVAGVAVWMLVVLAAARIERRKHVTRVGAEWFEIQLEAPSGD